MVRPLEWSGVVHCRVSRSVEVPSGPPSVVYIAKEHLQRMPPSPPPRPKRPGPGGVEGANNNRRVPHYVPIARGIPVVILRRVLLCPPATVCASKA